jgi:hypothetical protein
VHFCLSVSSILYGEDDWPLASIFLSSLAFHTANEGPAGSHLYIPRMKLLFPKQNYKFLSPSSYTHISVRDLYISRIGLSILLQVNLWTDPGNI